jgi:hypothetical protein
MAERRKGGKAVGTSKGPKTPSNPKTLIPPSYRPTALPASHKHPVRSPTPNRRGR